jgi:hypothetical protein
MARTLLDRLRFLLRGLREPGPARESEKRALDTFRRAWRRTLRNRRTGQDRRWRAYLVEIDCRSGLDRRAGER